MDDTAPGRLRAGPGDDDEPPIGEPDDDEGDYDDDDDDEEPLWVGGPTIA
jgi:hypothetical protein